MAEKPYDFRERSFLFAVDVVRFARIVADRGYILGRLAAQLVDAGGWSRPTWRKASPVNRPLISFRSNVLRWRSHEKLDSGCES